MAITIDWATKVISVPKADMTLIQLSPSEIRELDIETFRLALIAIEASEEGMVFPSTHRRNAPTLLGGIEYAQVVEIINGYTITFEDGQYAVNLVGANSNIADVVNLNQVSVRANNSAGLIQTREIQQASYGERVHINVVSGVSGTVYPIGTLQRPVNNLADAKLIASVRGLEAFEVAGDMTIGATDDVSDLIFYGRGATFNVQKTRITLVSGCVTSNTHWYDCRVDGHQDGEGNYHRCYIGSMTNVHCFFENCMMVGPVQFTTSIGSTHTSDFDECRAGLTEVVFDQNGSQLKYIFSGWNGKMKFINGTHSGAIIEIDLDGGVVSIDASCTAGTYIIRGIGTVINTSTATVDTSTLSVFNPVDRTTLDAVKPAIAPLYSNL